MYHRAMIDVQEVFGPCRNGSHDQCTAAYQQFDSRAGFVEHICKCECHKQPEPREPHRGES